MCQKDFEKIAALLKDAVNFHGGIVVATREEIVEYLQQEVGIEVPDSAIEHFPLCVRRCGVGITPHKSFKDGSVVVFLFAPTRWVLRNPLASRLARSLGKLQASGTLLLAEFPRRQPHVPDADRSPLSDNMHTCHL